MWVYSTEEGLYRIIFPYFLLRTRKIKIEVGHTWVDYPQDSIQINSFGHEGQSRIHIKGVRASRTTDFECSWGFDVDRRPEIKSFGPKLIAPNLKLWHASSSVIIASPRLPLSRRVAQALSSFSSPALGCHYHGAWLRLCRLFRRQPSPPTITAGGSGFRLFRRQPSPPTITAGGSGFRLFRRQPSPPTITAGGSGFRLFRRQPSPPTITAGGSGFRLFRHQPSPPTITVGGSGFRLFRRQPSPPVITTGGSGFAVETASHYHSRKLPAARKSILQASSPN